ncbi:MAG: glycosyl transferase, partial [Lachnospiraceae bacterium]|nr:glycosyl transferase [Lachnospiraceae bacterium]
FKVVDSDDWLDADSLKKVLHKLKELYAEKKRLDLMVCNYVYERVYNNTSHVMKYTNCLPEGRIFRWNEVGRFRVHQSMLMHTLIYRTKVLRESGLKLPKHTFYVDNLYAYVPIPYVKRLYYMNVDLYRYFIGREDQSVNEQVMIKRIDQQIRVNKMMIEKYSVPKDVKNKGQAKYMLKYLAMICMVTYSLATVSKDPEVIAKRKEFWRWFKNHDRDMYYKIRLGARNLMGNPHTIFGEKLVIFGYRVAHKIFKFN